MITTDLERAKKVLIQNELIAIPTETVYGIAGNAFSETAIKKIFELKKRPHFNPLIVHIKSTEYLLEIVESIPLIAQKLASAFWPGPLTLVLKKNEKIPASVTSGKDTVAVRVPNHKLTLDLLQQLDFPLVAPSANPFGSISPTSALHVSNYFGEKLSVILDGGICEKGIESTIIGFENEQPVLYRHGSLSIEEIEKVAGPLIIRTKENVEPNAPGMLSRHYAPETKTYLTSKLMNMIERFEGKKIGVLVFKNKVLDSRISYVEVLSSNGNYEEAASNLYGAMHRLDQFELDIILAEKLPDHDLGKTINDRLERASKNKE